uniref:Methyltransferase domain-containing protein n=1 Tax=Candidatus Kentrum eta TaxID=2126337 RepID=A0A450UQK8_9GAMM|nr:MAG: Methyltransferase domain-containing protein [Candidatus Kentron sp. H]VFJ94838.1 MAG: Methyltransferase domain-containing protein [Candidatus Kentron sp. H]VFK01303.1 MAG: Methyltransferase domain-containing protein [Candidatus Kentron sp. H]
MISVKASGRAKKLLKERVAFFLQRITRYLLKPDWDNFQPGYADRRIYVGCGKKRLGGYVHCDVRSLPGVEIVCQAWDLDRYVQGAQEVYSRHMLEHLQFAKVEEFLSAAYRSLKMGGSVKVIVPDMDYHINQWQAAVWRSKQLNNNRSNARHACAGFWGWQGEKPDDAPFWDTHKSGFNAASLRYFLGKAGFSKIVTNAQDGHLTATAIKFVGCGRQVVAHQDDARGDHQGRYLWAAREMGKRKRVLDLACGVGYGSAILREHGDVEYILGVDLDHQAIEHAREFFAAEGVEFRCGDIAKITETADAIISFETIEHLVAPKPFLRRSRELLDETDSMLLVSTPNQLSMPFIPERYPFHQRHYTPDEFRSLLAECGFKVLDICSQPDRFDERVENNEEGLFLLAKAVPQPFLPENDLLGVQKEIPCPRMKNKIDAITAYGKAPTAYGKAPYFEVAAQNLQTVSLERIRKDLGASFRLRDVFDVGLKQVDEAISYYMAKYKEDHHYLMATLKILNFRMKAAIKISKFINYLKIRNPDLIILWNGLRLNEQCVSQAAKKLNIPVLYMENGLLPNTTTLDPRGVNYLNSVPREKSFFESIQEQEDRAEFPELVPRAPLEGKKAGNEIELPSQYIFVPFQVEDDSQIVLFSPLVKKMDELVDITVECVEPNQSLALVFKEHPTSPIDYTQLRERYRGNDYVIFANGNSTQSLIDGARAVITINSTVGLEAALLGKPVITLGQAFYSIPGIAHHVENKSELKNILDCDLKSLVDDSLRSKFFHYLHSEYSVQGMWRKPTIEHWKSLEQKIVELYESASSQS